jgi:murein DD-endopeptidase MepM/ murein hydrolase activator NlpD
MQSGRIILLSTICLILFTSLLLTCFYHPGKVQNKRSAIQADSLKDWTVTTIPEGGSLFSVLEKSGLPLQQIALFAITFGEKIDVTTIQPGDTLKYRLTPDNKRIAKLIYIPEIAESHLFTLQGDSLAYTQVNFPIQKRIRLLKGALDTTLDKSLLALGLTPTEKQQINNGLESEVNFQSDARNGDSFQVLLEERFFGKVRLPRTKIIYVSYTGKLTGTHELFRYQDEDEKSTMNGLFTKDGKSNNTSGVGFPLSRIHTISGFGRRIDPIYGSWRSHQGIDYLAGYGTPVYAVANGKVSSSGWNGGYGNTIDVKHPSGLTTQYAHLSSIGVRRGQTVRRGQVIGRVGSTGKSTGAHLHFSLLNGHRYINPTNLRMVGAEKLNPAQMVRFKQQQEQIRLSLRQPQTS